MQLLKVIPNWVIFVGSVLFPVGVVYYFGDSAPQILLAFLGILVAFLAFAWHLQQAIFVALLWSFLFGIEVPILGGAALSLPTEPLAILLAATTIIGLLKNPNELKTGFRTPLFWAVIGLCLSWVFSLFFSTMIEVSAKYVFINLVYVLVSFVAFNFLLKDEKINLFQFVKTLAIPALFFCFLAVYKLLPHGFSPEAAALIAQPFFKDHTVFSATFSLLVPLFLLWPSYQNQPKKTDLLFVGLGVFLLFALVISSSRAAWIAVLAALLFWIFIKIGGTKKSLLAIAIAASFVFYLNVDTLKNKFLTNPYNSTEVAGNLQEQALSVANISSDVSNLERINRWKSALRMGAAKPISGFGPGTYQFIYFPFQNDADKTYISVDSPFNTIVGRGGSAHSEYLLLFSESGIFGLIAWLFLQIALLLSFFKIWQSNASTAEKNLALAFYLGCITYSIHSLFNNFLNTAQFGLSWWFLVGGLFFLATKTKKV